MFSVAQFSFAVWLISFTVTEGHCSRLPSLGCDKMGLRVSEENPRIAFLRPCLHVCRFDWRVVCLRAVD
jgi:hypothetical protein